MAEFLEKTVQYLQEFHPGSVVFRLVLAMILGGILGMERGRKKRPAGFRTYMTVCVGSALVMCTSQYMVGAFDTGDPARLGAQVISGIGFLGAGTIIVTGRSQVKGLTTAACLWASACIGLAAGIGFYAGAIVCTALIYFGMTVMHRIESSLLSKARVMDFFAEFAAMQDVGRFIQMLREQGITVSDLQMNRKNHTKDDLVGVVFTVKISRPIPHDKLIETFSSFEGLKFIEEIQ